MSAEVLKLYDDLQSASRRIAEQTVAGLTESNHTAFVTMMTSAIDLRCALTAAYDEIDLEDRLLSLDAVTLDRHLYEMCVDFYSGRYESAGRTLRFLWEMLFRADSADQYADRNPTATDGPGETLDDKVRWLRDREKKKPGLNWNTVAAGFSDLFPTSVSVAVAYFRPIWDRLNEVVHPSGNWRDASVGDSSRIAWPNFDADFARQLLADLNAVVPLFWWLILFRHPQAVRHLDNPADLFRSSPVVAGAFSAWNATRQ